MPVLPSIQFMTVVPSIPSNGKAITAAAHLSALAKRALSSVAQGHAAPGAGGEGDEGDEGRGGRRERHLPRAAEFRDVLGRLLALEYRRAEQVCMSPLVYVVSCICRLLFMLPLVYVAACVCCLLYMLSLAYVVAFVRSRCICSCICRLSLSNSA